MSIITDILAREILDSRGNPTIEVEVLYRKRCNGQNSRSIRTSTGKYEAVELRETMTKADTWAKGSKCMLQCR